MRHAGFALAVLCFAGTSALAAGSPHQPGAAHSNTNRSAGRYMVGVRGGPHAAVSEHECYSAAQTREKIALHKLAEPFRLLVAAANRYQADALGVRLCRHKEQLIYEISLLRANGRVVHVFASATTGQVLSTKNVK